MAEYQVSLNAEQVKELLIGDGGLGGAGGDGANEVLEAQVTEHIGGARYERTATRQAHRNGHRPRKITCRVGKLTLHVPQTRDGSFSPISLPATSARSRLWCSA